MIVYQCDWCNVQAQKQIPDSWGKFEFTPESAHEHRLKSIQLKIEPAAQICTACVTSLAVFIRKLKEEKAGK